MNAILISALLRHLLFWEVSAGAILAGVLYRWRLARVLKRFWNAPGSAFDLAIFRIVLFTTFFLSIDLPASVWYSQMPKELRVAPFGLTDVVQLLPVSASFTRTLAILLLIFCVLAALGLFTRLACWGTVLLGLYVLGLPHLYGKVNHLHHHLIWFGALMATSPCADVLSCDAIALSRGRTGVTALPADSREYALPLRFVWLLMGLIYFFPGFWKLWSVDAPWAAAQNMQLQMYSKWLEFDGWTPPFRIDRYPALCVIGGVATIFFEISFLFLVFFPRLRPFLVIAGLAFHNLTSLFMRIAFLPLQAMYVSLLDWRALFQFLGVRRFRSAVTNHVPSPAAAGTDSGNRAGSFGTVLVGVILVAANAVFGLSGISDAWPFACYPTFAFRAEAERSVLTLAVENESGVITELHWSRLSPHFEPDHARGLQEALMRITDARTQRVRFQALWGLWRRNHSELAAARTVFFYKDTVSTIPDQRQNNPLRRQLLAAFSAHD